MKIDLLKPIVKIKAQQLIDRCRDRGITLIITSTYRSNDEQNALYAQGRTKSGPIVTNAKGGESFHNWRVAFDVVELTDGIPNWHCDWGKIGLIGESLGLEWAGRWKTFPDNPHFQYTSGYTLADFQSGRIDEERFADNSALWAKIKLLQGILLNLLKRNDTKRI